MNAPSIRPAAGKVAAGAAEGEWELPEPQAGAPVQGRPAARLRQVPVREHRAAAVEEARAPGVRVAAADGRTDNQLVPS
jgi:hypothetical protein